MGKKEPYQKAAYGGEGWQPRTTEMAEELGTIWGSGGINSEWARLKAVLLHRPGEELQAADTDPNAMQMMALPNPVLTGRQHDALAETYRRAGVEVFYVEPALSPLPNQMFVADLMFMTPEGAVVARPASSVRAGEERWVARRLADLGIPIVCSIRGRGTFEGADAAWIDTRTVIIGKGLRTNSDGAAQLEQILGDMGVEVIMVDLPFGTMHLMGMLRFADRDLAVAWPKRVSHAAVEALRERGFEVAFIPNEMEAVYGHAINFVTLGPREIITPAGNPETLAFYENLGITCHTVDVSELVKATGAMGCLTGIVRRERV